MEGRTGTEARTTLLGCPATKPSYPHRLRRHFQQTPKGRLGVERDRGGGLPSMAPATEPRIEPFRTGMASRRAEANWRTSCDALDSWNYGQAVRRRRRPGE